MIRRRADSEPKAIEAALRLIVADKDDADLAADAVVSSLRNASGR